MKRLLLLYPRAWRERYGAEMEAVLADTPFDPRTALDLVVCAVDARLHPPGGRSRAGMPLGVQAGLLAVASAVVLPILLAVVDGPVLQEPDGFLVSPLVPAAILALAALATWRAGWPLGTWFCGLLAADLLVTGGSGWLLDLLYAGRHVLALLHLTVAVLPDAAVVAVLCGALAARALRPLDVPWPVALAIGLLLVAGSAGLPLEAYLHPSFAFRAGWLVGPVQAIGWGALTAAFLRRAGLAWWAGLPAGTVLWLLAGSAPSTIWPLPGAAWAAAVSLMCVRRRVAPATR